MHFEKTTELIKVDDELGLVYGWAAIFTEGGEEYFDTQGDAIQPEAMEAAAADFMLNSRVNTDLHEDPDGQVAFCLPITDEVCKAFDIESDRTGLAIAVKPSAEVLAKFKSGEYTGFSIGGTRQEEEVVEKVAKRDVIKAGALRQGRRRRMTKFQLDEIASVDSPAQTGAKVVMLKRKGSANYNPSARDPRKRGRDESTVAKRAFITTTVNDHSHLVVVDPENGTGAKPSGMTEPAGVDFHMHPWVLLSDNTFQIGTADGHTHEAGEISVGQEMAISMVARKRKEGDVPEPTLEERLEEAEKANKRLERIAALNDVEKAHFESLEGDAADKFLAKSASARAKDIEKAKAPTEEVYKDLRGNVYTKADDPRVVAAIKAADEATKTAGEALEQATQANLTKRADTEIGNLPGSNAERSALLKAIDAIEDEDERNAALAAVKAGNKAMKAAFNRVGTSDVEDGLTGDAADAAGRIAKRASDIVKADPKITPEAAQVQAEDELADDAEEVRQAHNNVARQGGN